MYKRKTDKTKHKRKPKPQRQGRDKSPLAKLLNEWNFVYLIFTKKGNEDFGVIVILICNIVWLLFHPGPGESARLAWPIWVVLYLTPAFTILFGLNNWIYYAFARTRAITNRHVETAPWYQCLVSADFMAVYALAVGVGVGITLLGLYEVMLTYGFLRGTPIAAVIATILSLFGIL